jgi:hypothetical protein
VEVPDKIHPLGWLRKQLEADGGTDVIREMVQAFAEVLMSAEASAICGAGYCEWSPERVNPRNGYRTTTRMPPVGGLPACCSPAPSEVSAPGQRVRGRRSSSPHPSGLDRARGADRLRPSGVEPASPQSAGTVA